MQPMNWGLNWWTVFALAFAGVYAMVVLWPPVGLVAAPVFVVCVVRGAVVMVRRLTRWARRGDGPIQPS